MINVYTTAFRRIFLFFLFFGLLIFKSQAQDGWSDPLRGDPISGSIKTENSQAVSDVRVIAQINDTIKGLSITQADGIYAINNVGFGVFQIKPTKLDMGGRATDVTTWDIALVSQHVLGIRKTLNTPYKIIAADVDNSGEIDATDILHMRRFVLGVTPALPAGVWRFVGKSYIFKDFLNPLNENFPNFVEINKSSRINSPNFVAIEIGDVNNSFEFALSTEVRTTKTLELTVDDKDLVVGNEYTINIKLNGLNANTLQGTFSFDGATVTGLMPGNLKNISDANFNLTPNAVTTSWNGESGKDAMPRVFTYATITVRAEKSGKLSIRDAKHRVSTTVSKRTEPGGKFDTYRLQFAESGKCATHLYKYVRTNNLFKKYHR